MTDTEIDWLQISHLVLLSRELDKLEVDQLAPQGKVKYQFSAGGHELSQVLLAKALNYPHDGATVYYRSRPFMLGSGLSICDALAAGMARQGGPSEGRDAGVMFNLPRKSGLTILPTSGDVGAQYTPAVGWAQAIIYRREVLKEDEWAESIAVALGGEGSIAANGFWAALNIVTTLRLPLLFFIQDNAYGLSVPSDLQTPNGDITSNLSSFGNLYVLNGDGAKPLEASECISSAVQHVRSGRGPCLLRLSVPRLSGHTFIDDQSYKSPEIRSAEAERDPIIQLENYLVPSIIENSQWEKMTHEVRSEVQSALHEAELLPEPRLDEVTRHLYYEGIPPLQGGLRPENGPVEVKFNPAKPSGPRINLIDAVRRTLEVEMSINPRMLVFGEDVGVKGGVHGATLDMQAHHGTQRVFDTSLSEEGIIGRATGMALAGLLPVPELQFRKYADPAHEQISDLGTIRWRTANHFAAPVVVRIPVGFGKKTGDPWHSVSGEAVYAHLPGWRIAYPSNAEDAVGLLRTALRGDDPTFFLEHRALLDTPEGRRPYPGDDYCIPFGSATRLLSGKDLCIITWGAMVPRCLEAAHRFESRITLIDLRTIIPWDKETVLQAVRDTGKVLIVHEDTRTVGFATEIITSIVEEAFSDLDAPIKRMAVPDVPIPYNVSLMNAVIPGVETIRDNIREILSY